MGRLIRWFLLTLGSIALIVGILAGLAAYGYSQLQTTFDPSGVSPRIETGIGSLASVILDLFKGDVLAAVTDVVSGLEIQGQLTFSNTSFVPVYIPTMEHQVNIEGKSCTNIIQTDAFWLGPRSHKSDTFDIVLDLGDIPEVAFNAIANGGALNIELVSKVNVGPLSFTKVANQNAAVTEPLSESIGSPSTAKTPSVSFNGWYVDGAAVSTTTKGKTVVARISLLGGGAGTYTIRVRRDISLGADETIQQVSFNYNGVSTTQSVSFVPQYAISESSTNGYHMDLLKDGSTVWTMTDAYPPRLRINPSATTSVLPPTLSVTFNGWYVDGAAVSTTTKGKTVVASLSLSGGTAGTYAMRVRRDVSFGADETIQQVSFNYNGVSTTQSVSFVPQYAISESSTNGYHMDLLEDGTTVWTMTDAYPPRLRVNQPATTSAPPATLSVTFNGWFVNGTKVDSTSKGKTVVARISLLGGGAGTYAIRVRRDISLGADETIQQLSFSYDGTSTSKEVSFVATYATGEAGTNGYHIDLLRDGSTAWTMTNAYPPRLRVTS